MRARRAHSSGTVPPVVRGAVLLFLALTAAACTPSTAQTTATTTATTTPTAAGAAAPAPAPAPTPPPTTPPTADLVPGTTTPSAPIGPAVPTTIPLGTDQLNTRWTVLFGGDALLTRHIAATTDPFARIRPRLADADLAIVNIETAIDTSGRAETKTYTFRSDLAFPARLADAGVDVGSLANNHALDFGQQALLATIDNLRGAGVEPIGAGADLAAALQPAELVIGGVRVAVLAGSQIIPSGGWPATATRAGIVSAGKHVIDVHSDNLLNAVRAALATHDVVLVVMHCGIEGDPCPSTVQRRLGALLRAAGATAVLGAHPHILQPIVTDPTPNGEGLVAYSLGNFIWNPRSGATADTGVLQLQFEGARLVGHRLFPHQLDGNGWAAAVNPGSPAGKRIAGRVGRACPGAVGSASSAVQPAVA